MKKAIPIIRAVCLCSIGLAFYMLMVFSPLYSDDWNYYLIFGTDQRISSLRDIFVSQYNHYLLNNGRFVPHFFVQLFDGLLGKGLFNIVNTAVFLLFLFLLLRLDRQTEWRLLPMALALILLLMPGFNNAFLWLSGACNYLWVAVLLLLFYRLMGRESVVPRYYPFLFLFGVVCGWTNEALAIGFLGGYLCYFALHRKELTLPRKVLLGGLIVGVLFLSLAPGSIHRFLVGKEGSSSVLGIIHQLFSSFLAMGNLRLLPLLLLVLLALAIFKKIPQGFFSDNLLWFVAAGISFIFVLITGHQAAHSRFGIELFSLILILKLLEHFIIPRSIVTISGVVAIVVLAQTLYYSRLNHQEYERCIAQIRQTENGIIETNEVTCPSFFGRLILRFKPSENEDYYYCQSGWIDRYFGKKGLLFLPHRFLERIRHDKRAFEEFETPTDLPFYAKRINGDSVQSATFLLSEPQAGDVPILLRPFADKMERYSAKEVRTSNLAVVDLPQGTFVLVMKNRVIANRVVSISVQ